MSKKLTPLEALENTKNLILPVLEDDDWRITRCLFKDYLDIIEKELKENNELRTRHYELLKESEDFYNERNKYKRALEIIKEKQVDVELLMKTENANDYNKYSKDVNPSHNLGQRQYELLKEVLL